MGDNVKKHVTFNSKPQMKIMYTYSYAMQANRKSLWMQMACDRIRFQHRIQSMESSMKHILSLEHRTSVYNKIYKYKQ